MSSERGNDAKVRLDEIAERLYLLKTFLDGYSKSQFLHDELRKRAVVRVLEEICEAALWFVKNENGAEICAAYPEVNFRRFGNVGNLFRHQYASIDYGLVWDNIFGPDVEAMERLLASEIPFYEIQLGRSSDNGR